MRMIHIMRHKEQPHNFFFKKQTHRIRSKTRNIDSVSTIDPLNHNTFETESERGEPINKKKMRKLVQRRLVVIRSKISTLETSREDESD